MSKLFGSTPLKYFLTTLNVPLEVLNRHVGRASLG